MAALCSGCVFTTACVHLDELNAVWVVTRHFTLCYLCTLFMLVHPCWRWRCHDEFSQTINEMHLNHTLSLLLCQRKCLRLTYPLPQIPSVGCALWHRPLFPAYPCRLSGKFFYSAALSALEEDSGEMCRESAALCVLMSQISSCPERTRPRCDTSLLCSQQTSRSLSLAVSLISQPSHSLTHTNHFAPFEFPRKD